MTIIQIMHSHTGGAVERHVVDLCEALVTRGHRVYLACPNRGWLWDAVQGTCITPVHIAMDGLLDLTSVSRLTRLAFSVHADILHSHLTRGTFYAVKAAHRTHIPVVATAHSSLMYKHYAGADRVLCVSRAVEQNLVRHEVPRERLRVVPHGIPYPRCPENAATTARLRQAWGVPPGGWAVGTLSRLTPDAGIDTLIEVAAQWKAQRPEVRFLVAGHGDEDTERVLHALVAAKGVEGTFSLIGIPEHPPHILAALDAFVAPSPHEPNPLVLLEAMAMGTPVVATALGSAPEILQDGATGILVRPECPEDLSDGLFRALQGEAISAMVAAARKSIEDHLNLARMVDDIEAQYRELSH